MIRSSTKDAQNGSAVEATRTANTSRAAKPSKSIALSDSAEETAEIRRPPPERKRLLESIAACDDILTLATTLLRLCRNDLVRLLAIDNDTATWRRRDQLRRNGERLFESVDDENLDADDHAQIADLIAAYRDLAAVAIARCLAEALDAALGVRFLPMFLNRETALSAGDAIPTPHPDWRALTPSPSSDPWALDGRLDALPHLRLASDWTRQLRVTLDGDWRSWSAIPQLRSGDAVGCALPHERFDEFSFFRKTTAGRALFYDLAPTRDPSDMCIDLLERAHARGCRVVVFPELSIPLPALDAISRWLDAQRVVDLVIAGSCHRESRDGRRHNESPILFRGSNHRLRRNRHRKFRPFSFLDTSNAVDAENESGATDPDANEGDRRAETKGRVRRYEDLAETTPAMRVFLSPSWTLAVLVCKDFIVEPVPRALVELRANLVVVPALTFKLDAFRAAARDIATWGQGIALVANAGFGARPRSRRPGVIVALPSQRRSVNEVPAKPRSVLVATLGSGTKPPQFQSY